jgi:tetratricopeptide (TPR) repeat protein
MRVAVVLLLGAALSGCGSAPEQKAPSERELLNRSAQLAFSRGRYAQAASLYEAALDQALLEDTPEQIVDARFNLALSYTYIGRHQPALDVLTLAEAERVRRKLGPDPQLQLLRATIHYRAGDAAAAQRLLDALLREGAAPPPTAAKAHFLAGVMAAERSDAEALRRHRDALPAGDAHGEQADRLELGGHLAAIEADADEALRRLDQAVVLRRLDGDYRGMARALAAAGAIAERAGRAELAGGYWLRAGRSAAQRGEPNARDWLERARTLGERTGDAALMLETEAMLKELGAAQRSQ